MIATISEKTFHIAHEQRVSCSTSASAFTWSSNGEKKIPAIFLAGVPSLKIVNSSFQVTEHKILVGDLESLSLSLSLCTLYAYIYIYTSIYTYFHLFSWYNHCLG